MLLAHVFNLGYIFHDNEYYFEKWCNIPRHFCQLSYTLGRRQYSWLYRNYR